MAGYNGSAMEQLEALLKTERMKLDDCKNRLSEFEGEHTREFRLLRQELERKVAQQQTSVDGLEKEIAKTRNECQALRSQAAEARHRRQYVKEYF